ncbi:MAG: TIGR01777 family protein [Bdellovibrionales bacterium RIFCSPHIGHO2_01_FULL_40_29]|nr:MAG: TIGR01777 family protein [Bdellovibrionales bacterium RIFCSPHIGHO2_01_FULL_40_29]OFZ34418.1 MAG: TIGR01777 family protein [Bdellovibrionales bacterium RIFCSPHIGHO2_02_FULL_40_15]
MKILITGATGFVGKAVTQSLLKAGHHVCVLTRSMPQAQEKFGKTVDIIEWNLNQEPLPKRYFENLNAIVHLAGESIDARWTKRKKENILSSRVVSTQNLLANIPREGLVFISTSAQGIYGDQGESLVDESSSYGHDFLAEVCQQWEAPVHEMRRQAKNRVLILRLGMVLSSQGGALKKMLSIYKSNLGAVVGSGDQWISWIHRDDVVGIITEALQNKTYEGVFNISTENPVQNKQWTKQLCKELRVMQWPRIPAFALKLILGEMASIVLNSVRMKPAALLRCHYQYKYPNLSDVFKAELS